MKFKIENSEIEIIFTNDLSPEFKKKVNQVYVIDAKVFELYKELFGHIKDQSRIYLFTASEQTKNLDSLREIYKFLKNKNVNRSSRIFGVGGGVTTDITGFAAATYKRGCRLALVPTTLLGMVDASIGGKTGINLENIKNGIGSFYPAEKVIINSDFLKTQTEPDFKDGFVEIVKMSFLENSKLLEMLQKKANIEEIIKEAIRTKMELCQDDLQDKNSRRLLNLGHTFGHVLESVSNYRISHGTAVSIGIRAAAKFSLKKDFITAELYDQIAEKLDEFEFLVSFSEKYLPVLLEKGEAILKQDKKADDKINLILFKGLQELFVYKTENSSEVLNVLREFADAEA
ncbi:MAG: 3-dehydroquinate synthase family protein [Candidatus Cloacimonadales bacterium]|nr:3-dehydroquinate synthase family protein [Candidatus Cloacimonadales bacterium]